MQPSYVMTFLGLDVPQHLWDGGGGKADVYKGQVGEEAVHGVWRWESEVTARMMSRFPNTVIRYMERKSPNMRCCNSDSSENPVRKNLLFPVRFLGAMW